MAADLYISYVSCQIKIDKNITNVFSKVLLTTVTQTHVDTVLRCQR